MPRRIAMSSRREKVQRLPWSSGGKPGGPSRAHNAT